MAEFATATAGGWFTGLPNCLGCEGDDLGFPQIARLPRRNTEGWTDFFFPSGKPLREPPSKTPPGEDGRKEEEEEEKEFRPTAAITDEDSISYTPPNSLPLSDNDSIMIGSSLPGCPPAAPPPPAPAPWDPQSSPASALYLSVCLSFVRWFACSSVGLLAFLASWLAGFPI